MANQNNKKKTNTNNKKNNTKKVETKAKSNTVKNENTKKASSKINNVKKENTKKEVKIEKIVPTTEMHETIKKERKAFKLTSKQKDLILVLLVGVVLIMALILTGSKNKLDIELPIALEGTAGFTELTYAEYDEKLNTEAPFLLVIVNDGCGYCDAYKPIVEEVANEYNLPINYINLAHLSVEERQQLATSAVWLKKNQWGTPTTLFFYGDTVVDSITQYVEKDKLVAFVKENFVIGNNNNE